MRLWLADGVEHIGLCEQAGFDTIVHERANLAWQQRLELNDAWQAEAFVQRHLRHRLFEVRGLLARQILLVHRLSDEQVLRQVANELQFGTLRADLYAWRPQVITRTAEAAVVSVAAPVVQPVAQPERVEAVAPQPVAAVVPAPVPEAASVAPSTAVAQAQDTLASMLEQAAQEATPFCEECERAKASDAAAGEPLAPSAEVQATQDAQAAVLEQAAQQATPLCEVCEQARAAQPAPEQNSGQQAIEEAQGAQATVLEQAADSGAPFCEICERKA